MLGHQSNRHLKHPIRRGRDTENRRRRSGVADGGQLRHFVVGLGLASVSDPAGFATRRPEPTGNCGTSISDTY